MSVAPKLRAETQEIKALQYITDVFTEISAAKMKRIRQSFEKNARFYQEITQVYHLTKLIAAKRGVGLPAEVNKLPVLSIAVTSNHRFYGTLNLDVLELFSRETEDLSTECLVIGRTGREYLSSRDVKSKCQFVTFAQDNPTPEETRQLLGKLRGYRQVWVYYPKFVNVFTQKVARQDLTQTPSRTQVKFDQIDFIFEPELPRMVAFFEEQVRALLFDRVMLEAELSRTAARLLAMSSAEDRADRLLKKKRAELRRAVRSLKNARLLDSFGALTRIN